MRAVSIVAITLIAATPLLQACSSMGLGGDDDAKPQGPRRTGQCERLAPYDGNGDGKITREELDAGIKAEFAKWDTDQSGSLSTAENAKLNEALRAANNGSSPVIDWNADGVVNLSEFKSQWGTMFDLCDVDSDDAVSGRELSRSPNVAPPRKQEEPKKPEGSSAPRQGG